MEPCPGAGRSPAESPGDERSGSNGIRVEDKSDVISRDSGDITLEYLLECRRDTIPYLVYLQGRYELTETAVRELWCGMTFDEQTRLKTRPFRDLFRSARIHAQCWEQGQRMYQRTFVWIEKLTPQDGGWPTPEWGFPKGRKNGAESDLECAHREVSEETGLGPRQIRVCQLPTIRERFQGTDAKWYVCDYFLGEALEDPTRRPIRTDDPEVSALRWFSLEEALAHFRPWEPYRRQTLVHADRILRDHILHKDNATPYERK